MTKWYGAWFRPPLQMTAERPANRCPAGSFSPRPISVIERRFGPLQARKALLYAPRSRTFVRLFLGSSAVEHSTVNRMVAGSNPARGAKSNQSLTDNSERLFPGRFSDMHTGRRVPAMTHLFSIMAIVVLLLGALLVVVASISAKVNKLGSSIDWSVTAHRRLCR